MDCHLKGHINLKLQIIFFMMGLEGLKDWLQQSTPGLYSAVSSLNVSDPAETMHIHHQTG